MLAEDDYRPTLEVIERLIDQFLGNVAETDSKDGPLRHQTRPVVEQVYEGDGLRQTDMQRRPFCPRTARPPRRPEPSGVRPAMPEW